MGTTVLVCTDGSDESIEAVRAGTAVLGRPDRLVLATVLEPLDESLVTGSSGFGGGVLPPERYEELDRERRDAAATVLAETAARAGLDATEHRVVDGAPGPTICDLAEALGADVIVMGTRGRGGLRRAVLGSVSDHVVRHAPCSVLITGPGHET